MRSFACSYSLENALYIQENGGTITKAGELFIEYLSSDLIVWWEL